MIYVRHLNFVEESTSVVDNCRHRHRITAPHQDTRLLSKTATCSFLYCTRLLLDALLPPSTPLLGGMPCLPRPHTPYPRITTCDSQLPGKGDQLQATAGTCSGPHLGFVRPTVCNSRHRVVSPVLGNKERSAIRQLAPVKVSSISL